MGVRLNACKSVNWDQSWKVQARTCVPPATMKGPAHRVQRHESPSFELCFRGLSKQFDVKGERLLVDVLIRVEMEEVLQRFNDDYYVQA